MPGFDEPVRDWVATVAAEPANGTARVQPAVFEPAALIVEAPMERILSFVMVVVAAVCTASPGGECDYRRKITIDHTEVFGRALSDFPVLVSFADPTLKSVSHGGHVGRDDGADIYFTLADGKTATPHEIESYDCREGILKTWVRVHELSPDFDAVLYMFYGGSGSGTAGRDGVWDGHFRLVRHESIDCSSPVEIGGVGDLGITDGITVEAWVVSDGRGAEALQPLVSKWTFETAFDAFDAYDAGNTGGLKTIGYFGAVFDGRYVYFSPQRFGHEKDSTHGYVLRYDTQGGFKDGRSWSAYDAGNTDGLNTRGFYGAVFDGRYVYFVPRGKNYGGKAGTFNEFHSNLLRYDTHGSFTSPQSWSAYDMGVDISKQSAAFDGRYIYFCPGYGRTDDGGIEGSSVIIRFDTESPFKDPSSYRALDVGELLDAETGNYDGAAFDGRYVYFVPLVSGAVLRYDTRGDYGDPSSWAVYDAKPLGMKMNVGAMFDGRYLYFAAYANGVIVRYDTKGDFTDDASWTSYDAGGTDGLDTAGFDGGFFDGRYVYFAPFVSPRKGGNGYNFHTNYLRYDTKGDFADPESWDAFDARGIDGLPTIGYNGGAFDGRYIYLAPWQDRTEGKFGIHGNVLRYDTTGDRASFCLKYCDYGHNGGLTAAVPGPAFIVNTVNGPVGVASHDPLLPGRHHLTGVYDGKTIKLFVDGVLAVERHGSGNVATNDTPIVIGGFKDGTARFAGRVGEVRISNTARGDGWIKTAYHNLAAPSDFAVVGAEEAVGGSRP